MSFFTVATHMRNYWVIPNDPPTRHLSLSGGYGCEDRAVGVVILKDYKGVLCKSDICDLSCDTFS